MEKSCNTIIEERRNGILWLCFQRPQARNALTFEMYERLTLLCREMPTDGTVRAVVLYGAGGKAFAAGTDMTLFRDFDRAEDAVKYEHQIDLVLSAIEQCPVPIIAAINGACTGGGASIAAACDIRIASETLRFGFPIARTLGNCLAAKNLARLSELIGSGRVREIIFLARLIEAEEALKIGLISEILQDEGALLARAEELAHTVGNMAPLTLRATKEAMRRNRVATQVEDSDLIISCYMSDDFRLGMEAFLNKTAPRWTGK